MKNYILIVSSKNRRIDNNSFVEKIPIKKNNKFY